MCVVFGMSSSHVFQECRKIVFIVVFFLNFFLSLQGFCLSENYEWAFPASRYACTIFLTFGPLYGPGVDPVFDRNGYQVYFLGGKGGRCLGLTNLPPSCSDCLEILQPQPSGTLRACTGLCRECFIFIVFLIFM